MKYRLGKLPARGAVDMKFKSFVHADRLPEPPLVIGHELIGHPWRMLANDKVGNCVFAGAAHEHMVYSHMGVAGMGADFNSKNVLSDYAAATGWDGTEETDKGADMALAASYRRRIGILDDMGQRHKITAYLALRPGDYDDLALALWLTGAVAVGVQMPEDAEERFDQRQPWDDTMSLRTVGGHYIVITNRNSNGLWVAITWGRMQGISQDWLRRYCDESLAYITPEIISKTTHLSPEGFALEDIQREVTRLTGEHSHA